MSKKETLVVGQKVWLETTNRFGCDVRNEDAPSEMVVLEANKTSAYIWCNNQSKVRYKVNQKTHQVEYCVPDGRSYRLWLSKEEYERNVAYEKESKELREKLRNTIDVMSLSQLKTLNKSLFDYTKGI